MGRENNFDLIRLFAAGSVLLVHAATSLGGWSWWLHAILMVPGVPVFFLISGYLIYPSFIRSVTLGSFLKRRFLRIYPALYVCFFANLVTVFALGAVDLQILNQPRFWIWTVAQLTLGQFYNLEDFRGYGVGVFNSALWTISVELQFYLLTPIVAMAARGRQWVLPSAILLFLPCNLFFIVTQDDSLASKLLMVSALPWFYMFLVGAWLSENPTVVSRIVELRWVTLAAIFAASQLVSVYIGGGEGNNINPLVFISLVLLVFKAAFSARSLSSKLLKNNDISYGIYIYHIPIINVFLFFDLTGYRWVACVGAIATSLAVASWVLIEKPALKFKRKTSFKTEGRSSQEAL